MSVHIADIKFSSSKSFVNKLRKRKNKKKQKHKMNRFVVNEYKTYLLNTTK